MVIEIPVQLVLKCELNSDGKLGTSKLVMRSDNKVLGNINSNSDGRLYYHLNHIEVNKKIQGIMKQCRMKGV